RIRNKGFLPRVLCVLCGQSMAAELGWPGDPSSLEAQGALPRLRTASGDLRLRDVPPLALPYADRDRPARPRTLQAHEHGADARAHGGRHADPPLGDARAGLRSDAAEGSVDRLAPALSAGRRAGA